MTTHTHSCTATGCQKQIPLNLLMCMTHWKMVPAPVAREVQDTWRAKCRRPADLALALAYREAIDKAQKAVHAKQFRKIAAKAETDGSLF